MFKKNIVLWFVLFGGYCQNGEYEKVIEMFREMEEKDFYCFGIVFKVCVGLVVVRFGKEVYGQYVRRGCCDNVIVELVLVDLYGKFGCVDFVICVYFKMVIRNMIMWNVMLFVLVQNGRGEEVVRFFNDMVKKGIKFDYISFIVVFIVCSYMGLVEEG